MRRAPARVLFALVALAVVAFAASACEPEPPAGADKAPVARLPARAGVTYWFQPLLGPVPSADRFRVTVSRWSFPGPVRLRWTGGLLPNQGKMAGRRTLTALGKGKRFEPIFADGEDNKVTATAPWVSRQVYQRLAAGETVDGFFEGGLSVSGRVTKDTEGIELVPAEKRTMYVCRVDGKVTRVEAISINDGAFIVADDAANPLVLEYRTVGVGWRLDEVLTVPGSRKG